MKILTKKKQKRLMFDLIDIFLMGSDALKAIGTRQPMDPTQALQRQMKMIDAAMDAANIIWAGCDCTTFSVAAIGFHRRKDPATGSLAPKTERAARADEVNRHTLGIIRTLRPRFFFIENPMGGLRKMDYMRGIPRHLITYCQYGFTYRKATDIWTNHPQPEFLPPCRNGDPCHQPAPRGTRQGLQGIQDRALRSAYPPKLCEHIVSICERYFDREPLPVSWHIDAKPPVQLELF